MKFLLFALALCTVAHAQAPTDNMKLTALYEADRNWPNSIPVDAKAAHERHVQVQSMLRAGQLVTGKDFYHAAEIFKSNFDADEALLAHALAAVAMAKGEQDARWLCATMLDRYLRAIWEPQLFGGEIEYSDNGTEVGRYRVLPGLVSDSMRSAMCIAPLLGRDAVNPIGLKPAGTKSTRIQCAATSAAQKDNLRIKALADEDQSDRDDSKGPIDWAKVSVRDATRQKEARRMLDAGEISTDQDYSNAGLLFQHGTKPEDYLLAHVLAMEASVRGNPDARWLFAVTLDRFLNSIWRPQVFGTQFETTAWNPEITQKKLDPVLLSDGIRAGMCVVPLKSLLSIPAEAKAGRSIDSQLDPCP